MRKEKRWGKKCNIVRSRFEFYLLENNYEVFFSVPLIKSHILKCNCKTEREFMFMFTHTDFRCVDGTIYILFFCPQIFFFFSFTFAHTGTLFPRAQNWCDTQCLYIYFIVSRLHKRWQQQQTNFHAAQMFTESQ